MKNAVKFSALLTAVIMCIGIMASCTGTTVTPDNTASTAPTPTAGTVEVTPDNTDDETPIPAGSEAPTESATPDVTPSATQSTTPVPTGGISSVPTPSDTAVVPHVHTPVTDEAVAPTCTESGKTEGSHCYECGEVINAQETVSALGHNYANGTCIRCGEKEPFVYTRSGETIYFGTWPQSEVTDSSLISTLNESAGTLPTAASSETWTSYEYYIYGSNEADFMWYKDITHGGEKYRGVYFTSYRPYWTDYSSSTDSFEQDDNGYKTGTTYWFKWEQIEWRILDEKDGKALLLCEMLIDSQEYYHDRNEVRTIDGKTVYANNYEYSNIRKWLKDTFYAEAFTDMQKSIIQLTNADNSASSTTDSGNNITQATEYACNNTNDYVFLLSEKEVTNSEYGFASYTTNDPARQKKTTAYAQCQGAFTETSGSYAGNGYWWLRSPYHSSSNSARGVREYGYANDLSYVGVTDYGICPALWITL